jgi:CubicO group peptidase (beta-lactamase class C family)
MIGGTTTLEYTGVRGALARCVSEFGEVGASYHAVVDGRVVADLWTGADFSPDTLVMVYSLSKPACAFCVHLLVDRGALGLDDRVADHWPEFGQAGKSEVTVRQVLAHQAGLVALRQPEPGRTLFDWERVCQLLAAEEPWWEPGTAHGEHFMFYGHLCAALVHRIDGRTLGRFWREEVAQPWQLDFHIGLAPEEQARTLDLMGTFPPPGDWLTRLAATNPPGMEELPVVNGAAWRAAEVPGVNGHATARGVARFFAGLANGGELDGVRLASESATAAMRREVMNGPDLLFGKPVARGLGVLRSNDGGFGMIGLGGSWR